LPQTLRDKDPGILPLSCLNRCKKLPLRRIGIISSRQPAGESNILSGKIAVNGQGAKRRYEPRPATS